METPNEYCYLSAATSPTSICSLDDSLLNFYSAPTSPTSEVSNTLFGFKTEPTTPSRSRDRGHFHQDPCFNNSFLGTNDFEFNTSGDFDLHSKKDESKRNQTMSFADELFRDGKVVPLSLPLPRLKLPPGFHGSSRHGGAASQPRSLVLGLSSPRRCLWNDDFDPFMVALETVKEEEVGKRGSQMERNHSARARTSEYYMGLLRSPRAVGVGANEPDKANASAFSRCSRSCGMASECKGPRGVVFARRLRVSRKRVDEPTGSPAQSPKATKKGKKSRGSYYIRENKRQKILRILFRVPSSGTARCCSEEETKKKRRKHQNGVLWKPAFLRRLSFRSIGRTQYDNDKRVVFRIVKMTLIQYRPRLSLCVGFGQK